MNGPVPPADRRGALWVHPQYQKSFVTNFCLAAFGGMLTTSLLLAILFYLAANGKGDLVLWPLIAVNALVLLALVALAGVVALNLSHKVGGPLYRIEKRAGEISQGELAGDLRLRQGDELQSTAQAMNQMSHELNQRLKDIGERLERLAALCGEPHQTENLRQGLNELAGEIKQKFILDY
jgi:methyl-accepting chemotaxis protein